MEILKNLSKDELEGLRRTFTSANKSRLVESEFIATLQALCDAKPALEQVTERNLRQLFAYIDVAGCGSVSWEEFTLFAIDQAQSMSATTQSLKSNGTTGAEQDSNSLVASNSGGTADTFNAYRPYHIESSVLHPFNTTIADIRCLPRTNKMVKLTIDAKGNSAFVVLNSDDNKQVYGRLPKTADVVTNWEYIPPTGGVNHANALACAYKGGNIALYSLEKRHTYDEALTLSKSILFSETQTAMVWSSMYGRLFLGSRRGIVSVWEIDKETVSSQEKLHDNLISCMKLRSSLLFTGCLERMNSVKAVDIEHSVVRYAFSDHMVGGVTTMEMDDEYLFSAGFEGKIIQRSLQAPKSSPACLFDTVEPHSGRMTVLHRVPDTPMLLSGDSKGLVKMWDLRMGLCMQSVYPSPAGLNEAKKAAKKDTAVGKTAEERDLLASLPQHMANVKTAVSDATAVNAICPLPHSDLLLVSNAVELLTLTSSDTTFPELSDDGCTCRFLLAPNNESILTVHDRKVKLWNTTNGHLIYATSNNLLASDISACALSLPLKRQFILGSMDGELKAFSVALGKETMDLTPTMMEGGLFDKEVIAVHSLVQFRDYTMPYGIVTQSDGVYVLPIVKDAVATAIIRLHAVHTLLTDGATVSATHLVDDRLLFVTLSNDTINLLDLASLGGVTVMYTLPSGGELQTLCVRPFAELVLSAEQLAAAAAAAAAASTSTDTDGDQTNGAAAAPRSGRAAANTAAVSSELVLFAADCAGKVVIGEAVIRNSTSEEEDTTGQGGDSKNAYNFLGEWNATQKENSWRWTRNRRSVKMFDRKMGTEEELQRSRRETIGAAGKPRLNAIASIGIVSVTHLAYCPTLHVLFTGDNRGDVHVWDVAGVLKSLHRAPPPESKRGHLCTDPSLDETPRQTQTRQTRNASSYPPVLITDWHAHKFGFTAFYCYPHPTLGLPVLVTGDVNKKVATWSADGTMLGTYATGRITDDASGGRRYGLEPFTVAQDAEREKRWGVLLSYMEQREKQLSAPPENAPTFSVGLRSVTSPEDVGRMGNGSMTHRFATDSTVDFPTEAPAREGSVSIGAEVDSPNSSTDGADEELHNVLLGGEKKGIVKSQYADYTQQGKLAPSQLSRTGAAASQSFLPSLMRPKPTYSGAQSARTTVSTQKNLLPSLSKDTSETPSRGRQKERRTRSKERRRTSLSAPPAPVLTKHIHIEGLLPRL